MRIYHSKRNNITVKFPHIGFVSCGQNNLLQIKANFTLSSAARTEVYLYVARCDLGAQ